MQQFRNTFWVSTLAHHLPNITMIEKDRFPYLVHRDGLTISLHTVKERLQFSVPNVHALNSTGVLCPIDPPSPITVDPRRSIVHIAGEVQRRLIPPALTWYEQARQWQQEDAAREQELQIIREQFAALGSPNAIFTDIYHGYDPSWQARINSAQSITLNLERLTVPQALTIIQLLQAE